MVKSGLREGHASGDGDVVEPQRIQRLGNTSLRNSRTGRVKSERHLAENTFSVIPHMVSSGITYSSTFPDINQG